MQHTATHCEALLYTAKHCNTLLQAATRLNTRQHTAQHCNTLQHAVFMQHTHCNTLLHTATHNTFERHFQNSKRKLVGLFCHVSVKQGTSSYRSVTWQKRPTNFLSSYRSLFSKIWQKRPTSFRCASFEARVGLFSWKETYTSLSFDLWKQHLKMSPGVG